MSNDLKKIVGDFMARHATKKGPLLLACSGGVDSLVLAHLLHDLSISFALAHCNFSLRGKFSDEDEGFVKDWATERGIAFHATRFDTKVYADSKKLSIQMAARDLRYGFFNALMEEHGYPYLLTAHHADDSLETILLNLGRGSGLSSLAGMRAVSGKILRPLLEVRKTELVNHARANNIEWRDDLSNYKDDYQRNFIRHHVVPGLKNAFPNFDESLKTTLRQVAADREWVEKLMADKLANLVVKEDGRESLAFSDLPQGEAARSLLYHWLKSHGPFAIYDILKARHSEPGRQFESPTHRLVTGREQFILQKKESNSNTKWQIEKNDGQLDQPIHLDMKSLKSEDVKIDGNRALALLDRDKLQFPLTLRKWQDGDYFVPLGMEGRKKLSDFFIDEKIDRFAKEDAWLLCSGEDICWVVGHRIDDRYKLTDTTKTVYFVRLK